jgi:hypothetical protein
MMRVEPMPEDGRNLLFEVWGMNGLPERKRKLLRAYDEDGRLNVRPGSQIATMRLIWGEEKMLKGRIPLPEGFYHAKWDRVNAERDQEYEDWKIRLYARRG